MLPLWNKHMIIDFKYFSKIQGDNSRWQPQLNRQQSIRRYEGGERHHGKSYTRSELRRVEHKKILRKEDALRRSPTIQRGAVFPKPKMEFLGVGPEMANVGDIVFLLLANP